MNFRRYRSPVCGSSLSSGSRAKYAVVWYLCISLLNKIMFVTISVPNVSPADPKMTLGGGKRFRIIGEARCEVLQADVSIVLL
jgi:hypothetical protein